jgi:hypothetical protein
MNLKEEHSLFRRREDCSVCSYNTGSPKPTWTLAIVNRMVAVAGMADPERSLNSKAIETFLAES